MVRFRGRSTSGGSYKEMSSFGEDGGGGGAAGNNSGSPSRTKVQAAEQLFRALLQHRGGGKSCLHFYDRNPALMTALLDRAQTLDELNGGEASSSSFRKDLLLSTDVESLYTPLHWAVFQGDLASVLFLLRHALSNATPRFTQRPMNLLENNSKMPPLVQAMVTATDREGLTPGELLASRQRFELLACRLSLPRPRVVTEQERRHRSSFDIDDVETLDEQNEFDLLSKSLQSMQLNYRKQESVDGNSTATTTEYGCEVLTFGQAHHCALGVGNASDASSQQSRPQRVQTFSQSDTGRQAGAVAIAAATHHTLVATADGAVYAFGLGKGGRLGLGESVTHCPTPMRVTGGSLSSRIVVGIAAAENHSIAVTACGYVYTWGSNRFGQLSDDGPSRSTPRRVEDLKNSFCVSVAAGAKHSVALSRRGEVFVWGDNTSGQLGISRRNGTHKVQRVEALCSTSPPKVVISVKASEQATLCLAIPTGGGLPVNTIYSWGHGSHVPSRVVFDSIKADRPVNPVAISCARYHNVAVSSDGLVYTWGLHAETLGVQQKTKKSSTSNMIASPQLVKGMLPENGGGLAVCVSASENHTAVLTDQGTMYTWGATNGNNVMGHPGVRWQPDPKRVPGVSRAVAVAAAKDHTVYLMGASFPPIPDLPKIGHAVNSLEDLVVRRISGFIDLFNAVPLLMIAERTDSIALIDYCTEFCRRNLDGVLTVAQRSVLDAYLNEQLSGSTLEVKPMERDSSYHPLVEDIVFAGSELGPLNTIRSLCDTLDWLSSCEQLAKSETVRLFLDVESHKGLPFVVARHRGRTLSNANAFSGKKSNICSNRCIKLTVDMDLSTLELAEQKLVLVTKEVRGLRKRLNQIAKLEEGEPSSLSDEQKEKVARRPQLEADLHAFEPALATIERRIKFLKPANTDPPIEKETCDLFEGEKVNSEADKKATRTCLDCTTCGIVCPDHISFTMHMNGRRHRNKVAQVKEEEEAKVAAAMAAEQSKKKMLEQTPTSPSLTKAAWSKPGKASVKMPRALPPPPHGTPDSLVECPSSQAARTKPSLIDIMEEESKQKSSSNLSRKSSALLSRAKPTTPFLELPAGAAPPLKSPPWLSTNARTSLYPIVTSPGPTMALAMAPKDSSFSLADYMKKPPSPSPRKGTTSPWARPSSSPAPAPGNSKKNPVSFADIQQQEMASKETEIQAFRSPSGGETNKWFIERRERAGSLRDIQDQTNKERENQLLVEEQLHIERMIAEENARREKEEAQKRKSTRRNRKKNAPLGDQKQADKKKPVGIACSRAPNPTPVKKGDHPGNR